LQSCKLASSNDTKGVNLATRKVYRVLPAGASWQVKHEGIVLSTHITKQQAIESGRAVAKANAPSQLVVHRADGTIEYEWTYGDDPHPPSG
jgi:hypothetical protein